ncbi:MAG: O-antigen ligase family protein, partial [Candidatus Saccharibacteria bacterium]|nr:O-antigen ligase family protein [Moraxellaceae bacterium]
MLAISVWTQADLFRKKQNVAPHIAAWLAVLPLFMAVSLFTELAHTISDKAGHDWHQSFANIRMLDDALLPCIFLLWQRPAWLSKDYFRHSILDKSITASIYLISTSYVLILWYDGARAVLISILAGLLFIAVNRRDFWSKLCLPLATLLSASIVFLILKHFVVPDFSANSVLRTGSSGRDDLWIKTFQLWQENPIFGIGGNNFVTSNPWLLNAHPHNMPLQLLCEWGVAGLLTLL